MTTSFLLPTFTPLTSMMESSGWNIRLARLKGSWTRMALSTHSFTMKSSGSNMLVSPTMPRTSWFSPMLSWMVKPLCSRLFLSFSDASLGAPFFITMIMLFPPVLLSYHSTFTNALCTKKADSQGVCFTVQWEPPGIRSISLSSRWDKHAVHGSQNNQSQNNSSG